LAHPVSVHVTAVTFLFQCLPIFWKNLFHLRIFAYIVKKMETLPVESIIRIFENCDGFPQVVALASVCKQTHAAWMTNPGRIIWSVATSQIPSFDDALMAVNINFK
jgi:hypothetical protein